MYKFRFKKRGLQKNFREDEVRAIFNAKRKRDEEGKSSEITKQGRRVDFSRIERHLEKKGQRPLQNASLAAHKDFELRDWRFRVPTPPPPLQPPEVMLVTEKVLSLLR